MLVVAVGVLGGSWGGHAAGGQLGYRVVGAMTGYVALYRRAALPGDVELLAVLRQRRHQRAPGMLNVVHSVRVLADSGKVIHKPLFFLQSR